MDYLIILNFLIAIVHVGKLLVGLRHRQHFDIRHCIFD